MPQDVAREAIARGAQQKLSELTKALEIVSATGPQTVVELGVHDGGTLWAWSQIAPRVFGVDTHPELCREDNLITENTTVLWHGHSRSPSALSAALENAQGRIDFLFVDADHHREEVLADLEFWLPHVETGGVVGFHDTMVQAEHGWLDVQERVRQIPGALTIDIRAQEENPMGIGLVML
jgi:cephalosporin hydroxylase